MTEKETEIPEENKPANDIAENNSAHEKEAESGQEPKSEKPVTEETPLEKAEKEAAEMKSRWLRSVADMENFRKRIAREKQDIIRNAAANVVESLLPVLDNMKLGLQAAENHSEAKDIVTGFKMVDDQLKRSLKDQGLEEIAPDGDVFDPNQHECISQQASEEVEEGKVIQTVRPGYRLNERLIRAANVIVSSGAENA